MPLTTAVLGGEVAVPTLDGPVGIKIPPGSRPAALFRLRDHGLPRLEAGAAAATCWPRSAWSCPRTLADREKELFEELRKLGH